VGGGHREKENDGEEEGSRSLSVPYRPGTPHTSFKSRQRAGCVSTHRHVPCGTGPSLPAKVGSEAATCPVAPDHTSLLVRASMLPCVQWLWTRIPAKEGSNTTTHPMASDPTSLLERALMPLRILWLQALPPDGRAPALKHVLWLHLGRGPQTKINS
jgi:hypothetical protein